MERINKLLSSISPKTLFERVTNIIFSIILVFITLTIIVGTAQLFYRLGALIEQGAMTGNYLYIVSDVLTLFILVELSRSLFEYFRAHRLRLTFILDAGIVFIIRDVIVMLFEHRIENDQIYALSVLLFVLGALRIGSVLVYHQEQKLLARTNDSS